MKTREKEARGWAIKPRPGGGWRLYDSEGNDRGAVKSVNHALIHLCLQMQAVDTIKGEYRNLARAVMGDPGLMDFNPKVLCETAKYLRQDRDEQRRRALAAEARHVPGTTVVTSQHIEELCKEQDAVPPKPRTAAESAKGDESDAKPHVV